MSAEGWVQVLGKELEAVSETELIPEATPEALDHKDLEARLPFPPCYRFLEPCFELWGHALARFGI